MIIHLSSRKIGTQKIYIPILNLDNGKKTSIHQHHNEIKEFKYTTDEEDLNSNEDGNNNIIDIFFCIFY